MLPPVLPFYYLYVGGTNVVGGRRNGFAVCCLLLVCLIFFFGGPTTNNKQQPIASTAGLSSCYQLFIYFLNTCTGHCEDLTCNTREPKK